MLKQLIRWLQRLPQRPFITKQPVPAISQNSDVLCEECGHHVSIPGFVPHLASAFNQCPNCHCADPAKLKYTAAWMRTEEEQRVHWKGRKVKVHRGKIIAINHGIPGRLPTRTVTVGPPDKAA